MSNLNIDVIREYFNQHLLGVVSHLSSPSDELIEAIRYTLIAKSKRLRPLLVYATGQLLNLKVEMLDSIATAIELVHTYSLIHDDLPAMDDDNIRRGQPSCHVQFNESTAILAGDALQGLAIELILSEPLLSDSQKNRVAIKVLQASGYQGMIAGQCLDLKLLSSSELTLEKLQQIHLLKTGCLLDVCIRAPLVLANNVEPIFKKQLYQLGTLLGLVFQIQDDYLDKYGSAEQMGKPQGADLSRNIKTFADFYEKDALEALIEQYYSSARKLIAGIDSGLMLEIINLLETRDH